MAERDDGSLEGIAEVEEGEPGAQTPYAGPQSHSLDDLAEMQGQPAQNVLEMQLDGDTVPEEFRGKKFADVLGMFSNLKTALKTSEEARTQALATTQLLAERERPATQSVPVAPPTPAVSEEPTQEQWKELYDNDPFAYQQKRFEVMERRLARGMDARIAPTTATAAETSKQMAKQKFPEVFEILSKEVDDFVDMAFPTPEARAALAAPGAWERVIQYVQGANIDKIFAHRESKKAAAAMEQRRSAERQFAAPAVNGSRAPAPRGGKLTPATLDETSKEIARNLMPDLPPQKAYEEYCKHYV